MNELPDHIHEEIKQLCEFGDAACDDEDYPSAIKYYESAFALVPSPHANWQASTWILTAIADAYIFKQQFDHALEALDYAMHCPEAIGNPYLHLRLGQMRYECNDMAKAADELTRAYMGAGIDIFLNEDPKYLQFLKTKIEL